MPHTLYTLQKECRLGRMALAPTHPALTCVAPALLLSLRKTVPRALYITSLPHLALALMISLTPLISRYLTVPSTRPLV